MNYHHHHQSLSWGKNGVEQQKRDDQNSDGELELRAGPKHQVRSFGPFYRIDFLGQRKLRSPRIPTHVLVGRKIREERLLPLLP